MTEQQPRLPVTVGRIVKPHGVRGELVVEVRTDSPEERFAAGAVFHVEHREAAAPAFLTVTTARMHAGRLLMRAEGVDSREAAERLRGAMLTVRPDELPPTEDPDEFHDHELEGMRVVLTTGELVGTVQEIVHSPAGELLAVTTERGHEVLVPFVAQIVPEVDLVKGELVIDPPEGLLDQE